MRKLKRFIRGIRASRLRLSIVLALVLVLGGVVLIWGLHVADVENVVIDGNIVLTNSELESFAKEEIRVPLVGPLFSGNLIAFPSDRMEESFMKRFPRIAQISFSRNLIHKTLSLNVAERKTAGIYCTAQEDSSESDDTETIVDIDQITFPDVFAGACFLMDADGIVFAPAPETEGSLIMTVLDATSGEVFEGSRAIEAETFADIVTVWSAFKERVPVQARRMLNRPGGVLTVETFEGWEAVFTLEHPMEAQTVALTELISKELEPSERSRISIIDLRVPGRIYYR